MLAEPQGMDERKRQTVYLFTTPSLCSGRKAQVSRRFGPPRIRLFFSCNQTRCHKGQEEDIGQVGKRRDCRKDAGAGGTGSTASCSRVRDLLEREAQREWKSKRTNDRVTRGWRSTISLERNTTLYGRKRGYLWSKLEQNSDIYKDFFLSFCLLNECAWYDKCIV